MKDSSYWMEQVLVRSQELGEAQAHLRAGARDEAFVVLARLRLAEALANYTNPQGVRRG